MLELKCDFEYVQWNFLGFKYSARVLEPPITKHGSCIKAVKATSIVFGKKNNEAKGLRFKKDVHFIPLGLSEHFPQLKALNIGYCKLKEISRKDLIGFSSLEELYLNGNKLKSLPNDLFADTPRLRWIYLNDNFLERLSSKLLEPVMGNLEFACFQQNPFFDETFTNNGGMDLKAFMKRLGDSHLPPIENSDQDENQALRFKKQEEFFESGEFADFTITVRDKEIKAHKFILAAQSLVFERMFKNKTEDGIKIFKNVSCFSETVFLEFLRFFYNGGVIKNDDNAIELFELAIEFEVEILRSKYEEILLKKLNESNVIEVYNLGQHHGSIELKTAAFRMIQKIVPGIANGFINEKDHLNKLITSKREFDKLAQASKSSQ